MSHFPASAKRRSICFARAWAEPGKGAGIVNELLIGYPRAPLHRRRGDYQDLASIQGDAREEPLQPGSGLFRASALEQVIGAKHDDQQIGISGKVGGRHRDLPAVLPQVADGSAGFLGQDIHPPAVRIIAATEVATGIVAVGVGVTEASDVHFVFPLLCVISMFYQLLETAARSACSMRSSSPLPSVRSRSNGIPHNSKIRFFFSSLLA